MRVVSSLAQWVLCCAGLLLAVGCGKPATSRSTEQTQGGLEHICFSPAKIRVSPVTALILPTNADGMARIRVCVALLDPFESYLKAPGTFRFELYERILRSAVPKGKRIRMWPDMDLKSAAHRLGCTSSQLIKLLKGEPRALGIVNSHRVRIGKRSLK